MASVGMELMFNSVKSQIKAPQDSILCVLHWHIVLSGYKCVGLRDKGQKNDLAEGSEMLPEGWNITPELYVLRYKMADSSDTFLLEIITVDGILIVYFRKETEVKNVASMNIKISDFTTDDYTSYKKALLHVNNLCTRFNNEVLSRFMPSNVKVVPFARGKNSRPPSDDDHLRVPNPGKSPHTPPAQSLQEWKVEENTSAALNESVANKLHMVHKQRNRKPKRPHRQPNEGNIKPLLIPSSQRRYPSNTQGYTGESNVPNRHWHGIPTFIKPHYRRSLQPITIQIENSCSGNQSMSRIVTPFGKRNMAEKTNRDGNQSQLINKSPSPILPGHELQSWFRMENGSLPPQQNVPAKLLTQSSAFRCVPRHTKGTRMFIKPIHYAKSIFKAAKEAETAAAKVAVKFLNIDKSQSILSDVFHWHAIKPKWLTFSDKEAVSSSSISSKKLKEVKFRVKEILENKNNGQWLTTIPHIYKDRYKEDPPNDLMDIIKTWTDIARVELVPPTDRDIAYPVSQENLQNPTAQVVENVPVKKQTVNGKTPVEQGKNADNIKDLYDLYVETKDKQHSLMKSLSIPHESLLKLNVEAIVYVTHAYSPGDFCVQRDDSVIEEITEQLTAHCKVASSPSPAHLEKGQCCAGLNSIDGNWTRTEILNVKDNGMVEVQFVDYGYVESVLAQDVRWLSPDIAAIPCQSINCSLFGIQPLWGETEYSDKALHLFTEAVKNQGLIAVPRHLNDNVYEIELYVQSDRSVSVQELLIKSGTVRSCYEPLQEVMIDDDSLHPEDIVLPSDNDWDVYVTYISATTESIMVRLVGDEYSDKLDEFQSKLQEAYMNSSTENPIKQDRTYVACEDRLYHRVRVISQGEGKVECYFLDHGDTDHLLPEQLHTLDPQINCLLPYQAVEVSLYGLEDVSSDVSVLKELRVLVLEKSFVAEVIARDDIPSVILYDTSCDVDININEAIIKRNITKDR